MSSNYDLLLYGIQLPRGGRLLCGSSGGGGVPFGKSSPNLSHGVPIELLATIIDCKTKLYTAKQEVVCSYNRNTITIKIIAYILLKVMTARQITRFIILNILNIGMIRSLRRTWNFHCRNSRGVQG